MLPNPTPAFIGLDVRGLEKVPDPQDRNHFSAPSATRRTSQSAARPRSNSRIRSIYLLPAPVLKITTLS